MFYFVKNKLDLILRTGKNICKCFRCESDNYVFFTGCFQFEDCGAKHTFYYLYKNIVFFFQS